MSRAAKKLIGTTALEQAAATGGATDPETVLLLTGDGTDGAQNNTFLDSSSNNHTITRNGNVTQGTFTPFSKEEGKWGVRFSPSSAGENNIRDANFTNFGTGSFTIECWINFDNPANGQYEVVYTKNYGSTGEIRLYKWNSGSVLSFYSPGFSNEQGTIALEAGRWYHIATVCDSFANTLTVYVDGVADISLSNFTDDISSTADFGIGSGGTNTNDSEYPFEGYISNFRVINGTALYTTSFTPPAEPLESITGTQLLTCQSNRFLDNSVNNKTLEVSGDVQITTFSPFANSSGYDPAVVGGSGYFGGGLNDTNYINIQNLTSIGPSDDFQLEFWTYIEDDSIENWWFDADDGGNRFLLYADANGTTLEWHPVGLNVADPVIKFEWTHICVSRQSGTTRLFKQGKEIGSASGDTTSFPLTNLFMGYNTGSSSNRIEGYVSDWALTIGSTNKTSDFPVPTIPIGSSGKELYLEFTNAGIIDSSSSNVIETVGNAQIDTTVVKYGTGAMEFDGNSSYLEANDAIIPASADFTVECWIYPTNLAAGEAEQAILSQYEDNVIGRFAIQTNSSNQVFLNVSGGDFGLSSGAVINEFQWHHIALSKENGLLKLFVDGTQEDSGTPVDDIAQVDFWVGFLLFSNRDYYFRGYIDDLRITKGLARYTTNFTPPGALIEQ